MTQDASEMYAIGGAYGSQKKVYLASDVNVRFELEQSATLLWGAITVKLPVRPGRHRNFYWMEINQT